MTKIGAGMSIAITAPLVALGKAAVDASMHFETAMTNLQSVTKQSDAEIAALSDTLMDMSMDMSKTTDSAQNLAESMYDIVGSGFEGAEAMQVLEAATMAASAGLTETKVAAQGIAAVINSYAMEAEQAAHVSDLMFQTVNRGVGTFEELTSSMSNVVGLASTLNVPFETVSAAIATMSKQGMSFSEASISMNQAMSNLLNPTREGAEIITKMGYASGEAMVAALGFDGALQAIAEHTGGSATEMGKLFSNTRSMRAALALTGDGAAMFAEDLDAMRNSTGATADAFAIQTQSFESTLKNFNNTFQVFLITIGDAIKPVLAAIMGVLTPLMQWFINLPKPIQTGIVAIAAFVAALGPLLVIFGSIISAIGTIQAAFAAGGVLAGLAPLLAAAAPLLAVAAAIVAVGVALKMAIPLLKQLGEIIGLSLKKGFETIVKFFNDLKQKIADAGGIVNVMKELGKNIIMGLINGIGSMISSLVNKVKEMAGKAVNAVKNAFSIHSPSRLMEKMGNQVVEGFNRGIDSFGGIGVQTPALAPAGASTSAMSAPAFGGGNGGVTIVIQNLTVPLAENKAQIDYIAKELGKKIQKRGGSL